MLRKFGVTQMCVLFETQILQEMVRKPREVSEIPAKASFFARFSDPLPKAVHAT
jgi:hypothetical protein